MKGPGDATPNGVWGLGRGLGWECGRLLGALTERETCCGVQGVSRGHGAGLWGALQALGTGLGLRRPIGCPGLAARVSIWGRGYRVPG